MKKGDGLFIGSRDQYLSDKKELVRCIKCKWIRSRHVGHYRFQKMQPKMLMYLTSNCYRIFTGKYNSSLGLNSSINLIVFQWKTTHWKLVSKVFASSQFKYLEFPFYLPNNYFKNSLLKKGRRKDSNSIKNNMKTIQHDLKNYE